jgi:hypothetical protein
MKRRGFLKLLGAAPIAIAAPKILAAAEPVVARYTHQTVAMGFALTEEVWFDQAAFVPRSSGLLTRAAFAEELRIGLNEIFTREYESRDEWKRIFDDRPTGEELRQAYICEPSTPTHKMSLRYDFCRECRKSAMQICEEGTDFCYGRDR